MTWSDVTAIPLLPVGLHIHQHTKFQLPGSITPQDIEGIPKYEVGHMPPS